MIDVAKARAELAAKTKQQIEAETAETWAARAIASYERFIAHAGSVGANWAVRGLHGIANVDGLRLFAEAVDYEHEAMEHASDGGNIAYVSATISDAKRRLGLL